MVFRSKTWKKEERRKYPRANVLFPVQFAVIPKILKDKEISLSFLGICRNIGGGGLLLEVSELKEEMLLCNNLLKLEIKLPAQRIIYAFARLVKAEKSLTQDSYYLRITFVHIDEDDRQTIIRFTEQHLLKRKR